MEDDIEALRMAALQTLHAKKVDSRPQTLPQGVYLEKSSATFDSSISSFPGFNSNVQLSPRSVSAVK